MTHPTVHRMDALVDALEASLVQFQKLVATMDTQREALRLAVVDLLRASFVGEITTEEATRMVQRMLEAGRRAEVIGEQMRRMARGEP